jgi:hypothetical protein
LKQLETEESIWFGQDKQEAILTISAEVADHFRQRSLLPHQQIVKEMDNGGLLMSSQYVSSVQLLSLIVTGCHIFMWSVLKACKVS